jgi:thiamine pyrophosphokinase
LFSAARGAMAAPATATVLHTNAFMSSRSQVDNVALVFLNSELKGRGAGSVFDRMWSCARFRACADGAANRLHDGLENDELRRAHLPDLIKGDLDSIRPDVRDYYSRLGVDIVLDADQNHHDLDKCLMSLHALQGQWQREERGREEMIVVVLGAFGGRLDQEMANLNMLFRWQKPFGRVILISDDSTAILLPPGEHRIEPNREVESVTCGLIPLGGPALSVTTTGLRWNLDGDPLAFGGMVSTSNEIVEPVVTVRTDGALLWTTVLLESR